MPMPGSSKSAATEESNQKGSQAEPLADGPGDIKLNGSLLSSNGKHGSALQANTKDIQNAAENCTSRVTSDKPYPGVPWSSPSTVESTVHTSLSQDFSTNIFPKYPPCSTPPPNCPINDVVTEKSPDSIEPVADENVPPASDADNANDDNTDYYVMVHVFAGNSFSVRVGDQIQNITGPATVRMVSNSGPPMPMPMQVPPGHLVQQIIDEKGILTHVILSDYPGPMPPPQVVTAGSAGVSSAGAGADVSTTYQTAAAALAQPPHPGVFTNGTGEVNPCAPVLLDHHPYPPPPGPHHHHHHLVSPAPHYLPQQHQRHHHQQQQTGLPAQLTHSHLHHHHPHPLHHNHVHHHVPGTHYAPPHLLQHHPYAANTATNTTSSPAVLVATPRLPFQHQHQLPTGYHSQESWQMPLNGAPCGGGGIITTDPTHLPVSPDQAGANSDDVATALEGTTGSGKAELEGLDLPRSPKPKPVSTGDSGESALVVGSTGEGAPSTSYQLTTVVSEADTPVDASSSSCATTASITTGAASTSATSVRQTGGGRGNGASRWATTGVRSTNSRQGQNQQQSAVGAASVNTASKQKPVGSEGTESRTMATTTSTTSPMVMTYAQATEVNRSRNQRSSGTVGEAAVQAAGESNATVVQRRGRNLPTSDAGASSQTLSSARNTGATAFKQYPRSSGGAIGCHPQSNFNPQLSNPAATQETGSRFGGGEDAPETNAVRWTNGSRGRSSQPRQRDFQPPPAFSRRGRRGHAPQSGFGIVSNTLKSGPGCGALSHCEEEEGLAVAGGGDDEQMVVGDEEEEDTVMTFSGGFEAPEQRRRKAIYDVLSLVPAPMVSEVESRTALIELFFPPDLTVSTVASSEADLSANTTVAAVAADSTTSNNTNNRSPKHAGKRLSTASSSSCSAAVDWQLESCDIMFELYLCERDPNTNSFNRVFFGKPTFISLQDLSPGRDYFIRACCVYSGVRGQFSPTARFTTLPSVPATPRNLTVSAHTRSSLHVKWSSSPDNGSRITAYRLEYAPTCLSTNSQQGSPTSSSYHTSTGDRGYTTAKLNFVEGFCALGKSCKLSQLSPSTEYALRVQAVNNCGESPWSSLVFASTSGSPPPPPHAPHLIASGVHSLTLAWYSHAAGGAVGQQTQQSSASASSQPVANNNNGNLGYTLEMDDEAMGHGFVTVFDGTGREHCVENLRRNTRYRFRLAVGNVDGRSRWSDTVTFSTLPDRPSMPRRFRVIESVNTCLADTHQVKLIWDPPEDDGGLPVHSYRVEACQLSRQQSSYSFSGLETEVDADAVDVSGMESAVDRQYAATGITISDDQCSSSLSEKQSQSGCLPSTATGGPRWQVVSEGPDREARLACLKPGFAALLRVRACSSQPEQELKARSESGAGTAVACWGPASNPPLKLHIPPVLPGPPASPPRLVGKAMATWLRLAWNPVVSDGGSPILAYEVWQATSFVCSSHPVDGNVDPAGDRQVPSRDTFSSSSSSSCSSLSSSLDYEYPRVRQPGCRLAKRGRTRSLTSLVVDSDFLSPRPVSRRLRRLHQDEARHSLAVVSGGGGNSILVATVVANACHCRLVNLKPGTGYAYRVRARNLLGFGAWSDWATVSTLAKPPSAPRRAPRVQVLGSGIGKTETEFSVTVAWDPVHRVNGAKVTEYRLEYWQEDPNSVAFGRSSRQAWVLGVGFQLLYAGPGLSYELHSVQPAAHLTFRVCAVNSTGPGAWSPLATCAVPATAPGQPAGIQVVLLPADPSSTAPTGLIVAGADSSTPAVDVSWLAPSANGRPITSYTIELTCTNRCATGDSPSTTVASAQLIDLPAPPACHLILDKATGEARTQDRSSTMGVRAQPEEPASSPAHQPQRRHRRHRARPITGGDLEGVAGGRPREEDDGESVECQSIGLTTIRYRLTEQLLPDTSYRLRVRARNDIGLGIFSSPIVFRTLPPVPGSPVFLESPTHLSATSVRLQWTMSDTPCPSSTPKRQQAPSEGVGQRSTAGSSADTQEQAVNSASHKQQFVLQMSRTSENDDWTTVYEGVDSSFKVTRLEEHTTYHFRVWAVSSSGCGEISAVHSVTTTRFHPPVVRGLRVTQLAQDTCHLEWTSVTAAASTAAAPTSASVSMSSTSSSMIVGAEVAPTDPIVYVLYLFSIQSQMGTHSGNAAGGTSASVASLTQVYRGCQTTCRITDLSPGVEYCFRVCAVRLCMPDIATSQSSGGVNMVQCLSDPTSWYRDEIAPCDLAVTELYGPLSKCLTFTTLPTGCRDELTPFIDPVSGLSLVSVHGGHGHTGSNKIGRCKAFLRSVAHLPSLCWLFRLSVPHPPNESAILKRNLSTTPAVTTTGSQGNNPISPLRHRTAPSSGSPQLTASTNNFGPTQSQATTASHRRATGHRLRRFRLSDDAVALCLVLLFIIVAYLGYLACQQFMLPGSRRSPLFGTDKEQDAGDGPTRT